MTKKSERKHLPPLPDGISVGTMVQYYLKGWRVGTLREVKGKEVSIIPIGTYGHEVGQHAKWVPITDIKKME